MNRKTYVNDSPISGIGIFARQSYRIAEPLFFLTGELVTRDQMMRMGEAGDVLIQVELENYVVPTKPALLLNHSCDPTIGIRDDFSFVALKYVQRGTELTLDYSTTMLERSWTMDCHCDAPNCRSIIKDFDLIPPDVQQRYLELNVVQSFIREELGLAPAPPTEVVAA